MKLPITRYSLILLVSSVVGGHRGAHDHNGRGLYVFQLARQKLRRPRDRQSPEEDTTRRFAMPETCRASVSSL